MNGIKPFAKLTNIEYLHFNTTNYATICVLYAHWVVNWAKPGQFMRKTTFMLHLLPDYSCNDDGLIAQDQRLFEIKHDIWTLYSYFV